MDDASRLTAANIDGCLTAHDHKTLLRLITCGSVDDGNQKDPDTQASPAFCLARLSALYTIAQNVAKSPICVRCCYAQNNHCSLRYAKFVYDLSKFHGFAMQVLKKTTLKATHYAGRSTSFPSCSSCHCSHKPSASHPDGVPRRTYGNRVCNRIRG